MKKRLSITDSSKGTDELTSKDVANLKSTMEDEQYIEQQMANFYQDEEESNLKDSECHRNTTNIFECPLMVPVKQTDPTLTNQITECAICGRYDWSKKDSLL